jgi:hypothetical protein
MTEVINIIDKELSIIKKIDNLMLENLLVNKYESNIILANIVYVLSITILNNNLDKYNFKYIEDFLFYNSNIEVLKIYYNYMNKSDIYYLNKFENYLLFC